MPTGFSNTAPPSDDLYGNLPYSTQTDAVMGGGWDGPAIMPDKAPMFGLRLLRLYDITGDNRLPGTAPRKSPMSWPPPS